MKFALGLAIVVTCCCPGWGRPCVQEPAVVCDLFNCSKCLAQCDLANQYWKVHCIGYYKLPGPAFPWWVRGKLICTACFPWVHEASDTGAVTRLEVEFKKVCNTCAIRGKLPVGHRCESGVLHSRPPMMTPEVVRLSTSGRQPIQIVLSAFDPDGDLMGIGWKDPTHGRLVGGPWIVAIPARDLSFDLQYIPPGDCWEGVDAFVAWAYDAAGKIGVASWC